MIPGKSVAHFRRSALGLLPTALFALALHSSLQAQVVEGWLDLADSYRCRVAGWARDPSNPAPIEVRIYRDGDLASGIFVAAFTANLLRRDLPFPDQNHGFDQSLADSIFVADGKDHTIYAYGVSAGGTAGPLNGNGKTLRCASLGTTVITSVAGGGNVFRGDGALATLAALGELDGLTMDRAGNIFVSDVEHNLVIKVSPAGVLTIVAGNGLPGFSGDGGPSTRASLNYPNGLATDSGGNLYIADHNNNRVRKVTSDGIITTFAGNGQGTPFSDGGLATRTAIEVPGGLAVDAAGNLYIASFLEHRIRKVDSRGIITTVAGIGPSGYGNGGYSGDGGPASSARLKHPRGIAVDSAGNLYVADAHNFRVRKINTDGIITTVAGNGQCCFSGDGGPATSASLFPTNVAVDAMGRLYISDSGYVVRMVNPTGIISTVAGNGQLGFSGDGGPATSASMTVDLTRGIGLPITADVAGNLYIADGANKRIRRVNPSGIIHTIAGGGAQGIGDGGSAITAILSGARDVALDALGNLYVADQLNNRVRKVTPAAVMSTVAGNGIAGFSGDGGPATAATLNQPTGVVLDSLGNLYIADSLNDRIRKVSPSGIISTMAGGGSVRPDQKIPALFAKLVRPVGVAVDATGNFYISDSWNLVLRVDRNGTLSKVAGTGAEGFSGDGGPATNASLNRPQGLSLDQAGNLYIADSNNFRIRKVNLEGIISTVAGGQDCRACGDGGPATGAALDLPSDLTFDTAGNLYISDNIKVRKVDTAGIITHVSGQPSAPGGSGLGDGGPVSAARLGPRGMAFDAAGNLYIADHSNDRVRKIVTVPPSFSVLPATLSVSAPSRTEIPVTRQIAVTSSVIGLVWSARAADTWLSLSPTFGAVPGVITVSADASNLAPGTYRATITVYAPLAAPTTQTVSVELTVTQEVTPQLTVEPGSIVVEIPVNTGNPPQQTLRVTNAGGGGALRWTAQADPFGGGNWLGVLATSGSASARAPGAIPVRLNVAGLQPGIYSGLVNINSSAVNQTLAVPVTLLLSQQTKTILTTQRGLRFTAIEGGRATSAQSLGILNRGEGTMDWTVQATTLAGGGWLSVSPSSGRSQAGSLNLVTVEVQVNPAGLTAGFHSGVLRVDAFGANNAPHLVTVNLEVLPAGTPRGVEVRPPQLIFTAVAGTSSPSSQTVRLVTPRSAGVEARGGTITLEGSNWLQVHPASLVISANDPRTVVVQPNLGNLGPGVYRGALTFQFDDGSDPQAVDIFFLVVGAAVGPASARGEGALACTPQKLIAADRILGKSFTATVGSAASLEVQVVDDCGNAVSDATVVASFSNGDPPLTLASLGAGSYSGTWRPLVAVPQGGMTVMIRANRAGLPAAEIRAQGRVLSNDKAPALFAGGIVNAASFAPGAALAPGSIVSVFGRNLALTEGATSLPLPKTLGGATLQVGGADVPLFYASNGQINAQLPHELQSSTRPQVVVRGAATITVPETITIAPARPGIFTLSQDGKGQGAILNGQGRLVDNNAPAAAGEVVAVYATGLGATQPAARSGEAAPSSPLALAAIPVTATVGGLPAPVQFAGLAPGFVGLYQVNVQIPTGVTAGSAIQLVLLQNGVPSNTVTLAVR